MNGIFITDASAVFADKLTLDDTIIKGGKFYFGKLEKDFEPIDDERYDLRCNRVLKYLVDKLDLSGFEKDEIGISNKWVQTMKESIMSNGGKYSTARMLKDYVEKLYIPLCNLYNNYYTDLGRVGEFDSWKESVKNTWNDIEITQENNLDNITLDAGNNIEVKCKIKLSNISKDNIEAQVYYGRISENGTVDDITIIPMELDEEDEENRIYTYKAKVNLINGGNYGYTFRVMPKHEMVLDSANLNLIKWITKE